MFILVHFHHAGSQRSQAQYGGLDIILLRSETQARRRVIYFLTVFTITGFASKDLVKQIMFSLQILITNLQTYFWDTRLQSMRVLRYTEGTGTYIQDQKKTISVLL